VGVGGVQHEQRAAVVVGRHIRRRAAGAAKVRAGVTEFKVEAAPTSQPFAIGAGSLGEVAADELATLLAKSGRFDVVGRTALNQSLEQQGLSNIIQPGSLVRPAKVEGVEYILVGNLSNLSVTKKPATPSTFGKMKSWVQQSSQNKQVPDRCDVQRRLEADRSRDRRCRAVEQQPVRALGSGVDLRHRRPRSGRGDGAGRRTARQRGRS
jgi:hypothetical protein